MNFKDMVFNTLPAEAATIKIAGDNEVTVRNYLPIKDKGDLITFIVNGAIDPNTGCFSPLRVEVFFTIAIVKWYTDIEFSEEELLEIGETYDRLEKYDIFNKIIGAIPSDEYEFIQDLIRDTITDIARFNSSFAGTMTAMSGETSSLSEQLTDILKKIENKEGMELLSVIKDVGGTN